MSSDEDVDIDRLRSDLINSIRSKKSRVKSNSVTISPSKTKSETTSKGKSTASSILDTDIDDLEALRRAALVTLSKSKDTPPTETGPVTANAQSTNFVTPTPVPNIGEPFGMHRFYMPPPPVLMGPAASFSQFPAPPPAYQPRFFNHIHSSVGFHLPPMRSTAPHSNLIVIQPVPRPEDQPQPHLRVSQSQSSFSSDKLLLPQDRYTKRTNIGENGTDKRKRDDKWSRFEDSSSASSSSSASPVSSDAESDDEEESDAKVMDEDSRLENGTGPSTPLEENETESRVTSPRPQSTDAVQEENVSDVPSDDDQPEEPSSGTVSPNVSGRPPRPRQPSARQSVDDFLLEEPEHEIEFLDEPVDEVVAQLLMADSPATSEVLSTPEASRWVESEGTDSPNFKERKKRQLRSEYEALEQQLEKLRHKRSGSSKNDARRNEHEKRNNRGSKSRNDDRQSSCSENASSRHSKRRDDEKNSRRRHDRKHVPSSVVIMKSSGEGKRRAAITQEDSGKKETSVENDPIKSAGNNRKKFRGDSSADGIAPSTTVLKRSADLVRSNEIVTERSIFVPPTAGEDLRSFLEKKKNKAGAKVSANDERSTGKMVSSRSRGDERNQPGTDDRRFVGMEEQILSRRDIESKPITRQDQSTKQVSIEKSSGNFSRSGVRWRNSGAASKEGNDDTSIGKKVKLRKRSD